MYFSNAQIFNFQIFTLANFRICFVRRKNKRFVTLFDVYVKVVNYFCAKIFLRLTSSALNFHYEKAKHG